MKIHHLNCISSCPLGGHLMDGLTPSARQRGHLCNHCLLIETSRSLVLVDTGFGVKDVHHPHDRLSEFFLHMLKPDFREELTALRQIEKLGYDPRDVQDIVLTHLDFDHAGGLDDFPQARVHIMDAEKRHAQMQKTWLDRQRYRPQQWTYQKNWHSYNPDVGETWYGFEMVQPLPHLDEEIALIPLIGHTLGHAGVVIKDDSGKWLLNAGDAYFYRDEMKADPYCTPGLSFYQTLMEKDREARKRNQDKLRALKQTHGNIINIFCSHDPVEFNLLLNKTPPQSEPVYPAVTPFL